jgi:hypothetical protein
MKKFAHCKIVIFWAVVRCNITLARIFALALSKMQAVS